MGGCSRGEVAGVPEENVGAGAWGERREAKVSGSGRVSGGEGAFCVLRQRFESNLQLF